MTKDIYTRIQHKHDTEANWNIKETFVPLAGELIVYDMDGEHNYPRFKVGDGTTTIKNLPFHTIEAEDIHFGENIIITTAVGNITLENGQGIIPSAGKNLKQVFESIWTSEKDPNVENPSVEITTETQYKEIGATVTPSYTAVLDPGWYQYGPATGIVAKSWEVTAMKPDGTEETKKTSSGSFNRYVVQEGNYLAVAQASWDMGAMPKTNLGNDAPNKRIGANSHMFSKSLVIGYKPNFYGFKTTNLDIDSINSATIRGLATNQKNTTTPVTSATSNTAWRQFFYAVPKGRKTNLSVKDGNNLPLTVKSKEVTVNHEGSASSVYTVFYIDNAADYSATTLKLTWS